ncbi:MAG: superoxide dismutase [Sphingobium sp.]|nr:superoxide dismutase [Sphingobium sp.]
MRMATMGLSVLALATTGCNIDAKPVGSALPDGRTAVAMLKTAAGVEIGRASAREVEGGIRLTVDAKGLTPGDHGVHVHTIGRCDAPDFMTSGGHWNPTGAKHGSMNAMGPHEGDLPNLTVGTDGRGTVGVMVPGAMFDSLLDADGSAFVIHASRDDLMTDPSGNSGARIACGVFVKS